MGWPDKINGTIGNVVDYAFFSFWSLTAFISVFHWNLPAWSLLFVWMVPVCAIPFLLRYRWPGLYKTASELDDEFNERRRFGKRKI
jgi:hypothetical protein